jgi:hypothetical protein
MQNTYPPLEARAAPDVLDLTWGKSEKTPKQSDQEQVPRVYNMGCLPTKCCAQKNISLHSQLEANLYSLQHSTCSHQQDNVTDFRA